MTATFTAATRRSLLALLGGFGLGVLGHATGGPVIGAIGSAAAVVGDLWVAALQMITLPLALALTLAAIASAASRTLGRLGARALLLYLGALLLMGAFALSLVSAILANASPDPSGMAVLQRQLGVAAPPAAQSPSAGAWIRALIPDNLFEAAVRGDLFPLLVFAMLFGAAVTRLPAEQRSPLQRGFQAVAEAMLVLVRWALAFAPAGVFALSFVIALRTGASLAGILGYYLALTVGVSLLAIAVMYPLVALFGRVSPGRFARGVLPAQIVAVSTRSSVASLPAMLDGGRRHLGLSGPATDFTLPLSVSVFRVDEVIANPVKLLFLAHVYGVTLTPAAIVAFMATVFLFSFSGTGTPNSGGGIGFRMLPVFYAAGIPIEGVLILEAVETIPDIFATLANVTGQLGATTILAREGA